MPHVVGIDLIRELASGPPEALSSIPRFRASLRGDVLALIKTEGLVNAAYSYNIIPLEKPATETLYAGGETLFAPQLLPVSGELTAIGVGVCTVGPGVEARITALFAQKRGSLALALNQLASEMLFALSRRLQDRMLAETIRRGLTMAGELRAGDPGLDLSAQPAVLRLAQGSVIGVELYKGNLMRPLKSISMVLGIGKDLPAVSWSRCDACPTKDKCGFRRQSTKPVLPTMG